MVVPGFVKFWSTRIKAAWTQDFDACLKEISQVTVWYFFERNGSTEHR